MINLPIVGLGVAIGFATLVAAANPSPAIPNMTNPTLRDRNEWYEILDWPAPYETTFQESGWADDPSRGYLSFYPLAEDTYLVEILVAPGAYNLGYLYMVYDAAAHRAQLLSFQHLKHNESMLLSWDDSFVYGLPNVNGNQLEVFAKSRGVGGCGDWYRYWIEPSHTTLLEMRSQACDDALDEELVLNPHDWPLRYQFRLAETIDNSQANRPAWYRMVLPELQSLTNLPIRLPSHLPEVINGQRVYLAADGDATHYSVDLSTEPWADNSADLMGRVEATVIGAELSYGADWEAIALANNITGFYRLISCDESCPPYAIQWQQDGVVYTISFQLDLAPEQAKVVMVTLANTAILVPQ